MPTTPARTRRSRGNRRAQDARRRFRRSVEAEALLLDIQHSTSNQLIEGKGKGSASYTPNLYEVFTGDIETEETHLIPRKSITSLIDKREVVDSIEVKGKQLDTIEYNKTGKVVMIEYSDIKTLKMSDKTLLLRGNPVREIEDSRLKRETSKTHRVKMDRYDTINAPLSFNSKEEAIEWLKNNDLFSVFV